MAPRLPTSTRRLLAPGRPLGRPPAAASSSPLLHQTTRSPSNSPSALPSAARPTTRHLTTTAPRPWLLSALPNLTPNTPSPSKTLRARRLLPYPPSQIYTLISDIDSYRHFLPHCAHSRVTRWTNPNTTTPSSSSPEGSEGGREGGKQEKHPALADLTVGWGPFTQTYTSRVYCIPGQIVEAVSGASAETTIPLETLRAVGYSEADLQLGRAAMEGGIFESLVTRWTVKPVVQQGQEGGGGGKEWTEVALSVTFRFANPALGFAVGQVADDMVDEMVEAFEGRARELYGRR